MNALQHKYDVFISHASEDKAACARVLAEELQEYGANIWYDEFSLEIGDSLSKSINDGLSKSNYGIVVLSRIFLNKGWTNYELEGLINREIGNRKIILPIWHNITHSELMDFSPVLAGKVALDTTKMSIEEIAFRIIKVIRPDIYNNIYRKAQYKDLLASAEVKTISSSEFIKKAKFGPIKHKTLPTTLLKRIQLINAIFSEVLSNDLQKAIDNFQRDVNPESEIQVWERMGAAYIEFTQSEEINISQKKEALSFLLAASFGKESEGTFTPKHLNIRQANQLSTMYHNTPEISKN